MDAEQFLACRVILGNWFRWRKTYSRKKPTVDKKED